MSLTFPGKCFTADNQSFNKVTTTHEKRCKISLRWHQLRSCLCISSSRLQDVCSTDQGVTTVILPSSPLHKELQQQDCFPSPSLSAFFQARRAAASSSSGVFQIWLILSQGRRQMHMDKSQLPHGCRWGDESDCLLLSIATVESPDS